MTRELQLMALVRGAIDGKYAEAKGKCHAQDSWSLGALEISTANREGAVMTNIEAIYYDYYDAGAFRGETDHWFMFNFFTMRDGKRVPGQSQLVKARDLASTISCLNQSGYSVIRRKQ